MGLSQRMDTNRRPSAIFDKVEQDIDFLRARIDLMQGQNKPNEIVLATYRAMLTEREDVLRKLLQR